MYRARIIACPFDKSICDNLNRESGRLYTEVMVNHYRIWRRSNHWLSVFGADKLNDFYNKSTPKLLHSQSVNIVQQGFYKAINTAKAIKKINPKARYPHKRKWYQTTIWNSLAFKQKDNYLTLKLARGCDSLPSVYIGDIGQVKEVKLVYHRSSAKYFLHFLTDDGKEFEHNGYCKSAGIDLGEIHPIAISTEDKSLIITCREMRSQHQRHNKSKAELRSKLDKCQKYSKRYQRIKLRMYKNADKHKNRIRDFSHKVTKASVDFLVSEKVGHLAIGNVRNIADKTKESKRVGRQVRQKLSNWNHGMIRKYLGYKCAFAGIRVDDKVSEHYTSQTCLNCGSRNKANGRNYHCSQCQFSMARDSVGSANILSRFLTGTLGIVKTQETKYQRPVKFNKSKPLISVAPMVLGQVDAYGQKGIC